MVARRGPGLLGAVARTAVVAGTATATANAVNDRRARRQQMTAEEEAQGQAAYDQQQQIAAMQQQMAAQQAAPTGADLATKLKQLADLNASGALSDAEFSAAKAQLLGG